MGGFVLGGSGGQAVAEADPGYEEQQEREKWQADQQDGDHREHLAGGVTVCTTGGHLLSVPTACAICPICQPDG
ncbi:hypothetical protein Pa4123_80360 [Phytohabitans aurantiacus]|uniref:Uncharacterized protein n=1 Tax=Phytohabitans aurantiacus TaxID=3016789 RepID=A0ABQ5R8P8_9ACTN|nr:hypothetical protein Pa4123_80360 [Phytohabitans aurantiacus]